MTPEEQRIVIAPVVMDPNHICRCGRHWLQSDHLSCGNSIANYPVDLNAMHEAEKTLSDDEYTAYEDIMWSLMDAGFAPIKTAGGTSVVMPTKRIRASSATAAQRLEAFLKVKGLWKE